MTTVTTTHALAAKPGRVLSCTVDAAHTLSCTVTQSLTSEAGRVLLSSSAALLMCLFLSPRFISFLRDHGFGKNIREEGPEGHKVKAGTPTMGGIIIVLAASVPFLCLSTRDWKSMAVWGTTVAAALLGFADDYIQIIKRRSLGLRGRTKLIGQILISVGLWWVATHKAGISSTID
ncbi:MAG TPA: hypothetical protein VME01_07755, partial [Solirubrobacteraceae bacterium]|nr:hypothetical protein [Solirubrobacteraceae bacterium]